MRFPSRLIINLAILINAGLCAYNLFIGNAEAAARQAFVGLILSVVQIAR
jgi:hypothetical protein